MHVLLSLALAAGPPAGAPLTLDEALAEAARASADVKLARASAELSGVDVYGSFAGVLPRLDLSAAFGRDFVGARRAVEAIPAFARVDHVVARADLNRAVGGTL